MNLQQWRGRCLPKGRASYRKTDKRRRDEARDQQRQSERPGEEYQVTYATTTGANEINAMFGT
jgi:hypothetical protein